MDKIVSNHQRPIVFNFLFVFFVAFVYLQSMFPNLERTLYWGEMLCVPLFFESLAVSCKIQLQRRIISVIYAWIFFFPLYTLIITYSFWDKEVNVYYLYRHLVLFYYALFFFAGYKWGNLLLHWLSKIYIPLFIVSLLQLIIMGGYHLSYGIWFGLLWLAALKRHDSKLMFWGGFIVLAFINYFMGVSGTAKVTAYFIMLVPFLLVFVKWWEHYRPSGLLKTILFRTTLISILGVVVFLEVKYGSMLMDMSGRTEISYFDANQQIPKNVNSTHYLFTQFSDANAYWRFSLWAYYLYKFTENLFGIGLGTPYYDMDMAFFLNMPLLPGKEYLVPAHNFFITLLVRCGIPFLILFSIGAFYCSRLFYTYLSLVNYSPLSRVRSRVVFSSVILFSLTIITASFNVVVESPLNAWFFWLSFGLFVRLCGDYISDNRDKESRVAAT